MKITLEARRFTLSGELERYVHRKLTSLQRNVPRAIRQAAECSVKFSVIEFENGKASTCNIVLKAGDTTHAVSETTEHMYAAFDIAVARVRQRLIEARKAAKAARPKRRFGKQS